MKAIILAAGQGSRLKPLTNNIPKPLIKICGKTILEYNLDNIYQYVDEIIIIVNYKKELFFDIIGNNYLKTKITYVEQKAEYLGTGGALKGLNIKANEDLLILNGDSIFEKKDIQKIIFLNGYGTLVQNVENPQNYGIFLVENGKVKKIIEKPTINIGNLANLGVYKFSGEIIEISNKIQQSQRGEYEITDSLNIFIQKNEFNLINIDSEFIDIGYPWHILQANNYILNKFKENNINGDIEENVNIKGNVYLGKGSILKSGTYIEGNVYIDDNVTIGPNTYIRGNTVIGKNCNIGNAVEIKNSNIGDNVNIAHLSYIGDSVLGNNINIGGGFITANLRHDHKKIKVMIKKQLIDTNLNKFGCIIGDNVKVGIKNCIYPGRIINTQEITLPGEIIK